MDVLEMYKRRRVIKVIKTDHVVTFRCGDTVDSIIKEEYK